MGTNQEVEFSRPSIKVEVVENKGPSLLDLVSLIADPAEDRKERRGYYPKSFEFTFRLPNGEQKTFIFHIHGVEGLSYRRNDDRFVHLTDGMGNRLPRDEKGGERLEVIHYIGSYNFHTRTGTGELQFHVVRH